MSSVNPSRTSAFHVLAPDLVPTFSASEYALAEHSPIKLRELFDALLQPNEYQNVLAEAHIYLKRHFSETQSQYQSEFTTVFDPDFRLAKLDLAPMLPLAIPLPAHDYPYCLAQIAPVGLTELNWLQNFTQAATSYEPLAVDLMAVYLKLQRGKPFKNLLQAQLLEAGIDLSALHTYHFAQRQALSEILLDFATVQVALGQFPRVFFAEILGFTLACCVSTPLLQGLLPQLPGLHKYFLVRQAALGSVVDAIKDVMRAYMQLFSAEQPSLWQRFQTGYGLYRHLTWRSHFDLAQRLEQMTPPDQQLIDLIRQKATVAKGHHRQVQLAGQSLDAWFQQQPFAGNAFLNALRRSDYVDLQNPMQSRLLKLFNFDQPMFGVLNDDEKPVLIRWLNSLPTIAPTEHESNSERGAAPLTQTEVVNFPMGRKSALSTRKLANPALFHALLNVDLYPEALVPAKRKVQQVLRWSHWLNRLPFQHYSHTQFENYIDQRYQREIKAYHPVGTPKLSKQTYRWGIEQFAPTILTDGCWLQNISQWQQVSNHAIGDLLFKIYSDELGAGILNQNHPYIYQRLLSDLDIRLPALHTIAFSEYPGFLPSAFDIPVYLLALSKFPNAFLPELLGVNMAIELSGLGNGYLRLAEALRYWGIDPSIVTVHISIDNLASGHAALAKTAIKMYMDELAINQGIQMIDEHWQRIYNGFCSLAIVSWRFKMALIYHYFVFKRT